MSDTFDLIIPLPSGNNLVVSQNRDQEYEKEIFIGLVDNRGCWFQDLAVVRNAYDIDENCRVVWKKGQMEVLVYADKFDEDYTHKFFINELEDDEL